MEWDDLRYVLALGEEKTLAAAARALGVAHSTVYRRLRSLEESHGQRLFERRGDAYAPTDVGAAVLAEARQVHHHVQAATRQLAAADPSVSGTVTVTMAEAFTLFLSPALHRFRAQYPELQLTVDVTSAPRRLERGEADVALRVAHTPTDTLVGRKVSRIRYCVYRGELQTDDRADDWVVLAPPLDATDCGQWEKAHARTVRLATSSRLLFFEAVKSGVGKGLLPCGLADPEPELRREGDVIEALDTPLWVLTHADLRKSPRVSAVVEFLSNYLSERQDRMLGECPT